jgi:hypothetical protein
MQAVNSKVTPLPAYNIIFGAVEQLGTGDVPPQAALAAIAEEMNMPRTDVEQIGNTVFVGHRGKGDTKNKMVGRAFNLDTGQNFLNNIMTYITHLRRKGVDGYATQYADGVYDPIFKVLERKQDELGIRVRMAQRPNKTAVGLEILSQNEMQG